MSKLSVSTLYVSNCIVYGVSFLKLFNLNKGLDIYCYSAVSGQFQPRLHSVDVIFNYGSIICHISYSSYFDIIFNKKIYIPSISS